MPIVDSTVAQRASLSHHAGGVSLASGGFSVSRGTSVTGGVFVAVESDSGPICNAPFSTVTQPTTTSNVMSDAVSFIGASPSPSLRMLDTL